MKINEITTFNKTLSQGLTDKFNPKIHEFLAKKGWSKLNEGHFSIVYINKPKDTVLKINKIKDPAYEYFMGLAKSHPNPYFPRVTDILPINKGYYAYLMERLYPFTDMTLVFRLHQATKYLKAEKDREFGLYFPN